MPTAYRVLGQQSPAAATLVALYTVPAGGSAVISSVSVCNRAATPTTFRVSVAVAGAADAGVQYVFYDVPLAGLSTVMLTAGLTLGAADVLRVYAGAANVTFQAFGQETTP